MINKKFTKNKMEGENKNKTVIALDYLIRHRFLLLKLGCGTLEVDAVNFIYISSKQNNLIVKNTGINFIKPKKKLLYDMLSHYEFYHKPLELKIPAYVRFENQCGGYIKDVVENKDKVIEIYDKTIKETYNVIN